MCYQSFVPHSEEASSQLAEINKVAKKILTNYKDGLSLAQLPVQFKQNLSFDIDLEKLGFKKFKDMLLALDNPKVSIVQRGVNHPFAILSEEKEEQKRPEQPTFYPQPVYQPNQQFFYPQQMQQPQFQQYQNIQPIANIPLNFQMPSQSDSSSVSNVSKISRARSEGNLICSRKIAQTDLDFSPVTEQGSPDEESPNARGARHTQKAFFTQQSFTIKKP